MRVGGADAICRIEADPAEVRHERLGPSVAGLLIDHAVGAEEMSGNEARRHAAGARAGDEDMRVVLAYPALQAEGFDRRGATVGGIFVKRHVLVDLHHQRMQKPEHVVFRFRTQLARKCRHRRIDFGQRCRAQEQARRKAFIGASEHAAGVVGLDQALDRDGEVGDRPLGQDMRDIAECILMHIEPRIGGDVDLPFRDVLSVMAAGCHSQDLNDAGGRRFVTVAGGMGNSQAHDVPGRELNFGPRRRYTKIVMPGLDPGIHVFLC